VHRNRQQVAFDLSIFTLLIAIGAAGRWGQPEWCFTPIGAAAVFAGYYFASVAVAVLVPIATLVVSDLVLPAYDNLPVMIATYAVMTLPVWLGRWLRSEQRGVTRAARWALCGFVPATAFFLVSNFAVWAFQSDYEKSLAGLAHCYAAAVPFYRWMLAGDVFYLVVLFSCWALAGALSSKPERITIPVTGDRAPRN
jgi:hypothetical protein